MWTEALINDLMKNVVNKPVMYSVDDVRNVQRHLNQVMDIVGKRILVVGSQVRLVQSPIERLTTSLFVDTETVDRGPPPGWRRRQRGHRGVPVHEVTPSQCVHRHSQAAG